MKLLIERRLVVIIIASIVVAGAGYLFVSQLMQNAAEVDEGVVAFKNGDYQRSLTILAPHAQRGDESALQVMAHAYTYGNGVTKDRQKAALFYRRVENSEKDVSDTYLWIARSFEKGEYGIPVDKSDALEWYQIAAAAGRAEARDYLKHIRDRP